jgi:hypothetical protein
VLPPATDVCKELPARLVTSDAACIISEPGTLDELLDDCGRSGLPVLASSTFFVVSTRSVFF